MDLSSKNKAPLIRLCIVFYAKKSFFINIPNVAGAVVYGSDAGPGVVVEAFLPTGPGPQGRSPYLES